MKFQNGVQKKGISVFTQSTNEKKNILFFLCAFCLLVLLTACGTTTTTGNTTIGNTQNTVIALKHQPIGTATLNWDPNTKVLQIQILLTGLAPNSIHPAHIHQGGNCGQNGNILFMLNNVVANATGNITGSSATTIVKNVTNGIPASGWFVNIHNGPNLTPQSQFTPIACGNVFNQQTSITTQQEVKVPLIGVPNANNQNVSGTALLKVNNNTLTVTLTLTGLVPNSIHAAHIHKGSCANQGAIAVQLPQIKANPSGNVNITFPPIKGILTIPQNVWYVNIHFGSMAELNTQTGFDPIACGNVL